jgi:hypothetical protein
MPVSPTITACCDSIEPSMVPSIRNAPSAFRSPWTSALLPSTFSISAMASGPSCRFCRHPI